MNKNDINKLTEFLTTFEKSTITVDELSKELSLNKEELVNFLSDYKNYSEIEVFEWFYIKKKYYINGVEDSSSFAHLNKQARAVAVLLNNRYYVSDERKADLRFYRLKGLDFIKGSVDNSDIGGLYTSAYVDSICQYSEVPEITKLEDLFKFLPEDISVNYSSSQNEYTLSIKDFTVTSKSIKIGLVDLIENFLKNKEHYLVQLEENDEDNVISFKTTLSNVFYTESAARDWIREQKFEESDFSKYKILKV